MSYRIRYKRRFLRDLAALPIRFRTAVEKIVFDDGLWENPHATGRLEKLVGYETYYKIRVGNYRIGVELKSETMVFCRVLHRKDIYRYFPG